MVARGSAACCGSANSSPSQHHPSHPGASRASSSQAQAQDLLPAHGAWETQQPFALAQVDLKDIRDEATLGPRLVHHRTQAHLPRSQWDLLGGPHPPSVPGP